MIARITRILLLVQCLAAAGFAWLIWRGLEPVAPATASMRPALPALLLAVMLGIAAVLAIRLAINLNNFCLAWLYRGQPVTGRRLGARAGLRLLTREFIASMAMSSWHMAFCRVPPAAAGRSAALPVLLVHGYGCNRGYWRAMTLALERAGIGYRALDLEPAFGAIESHAPRVRQAVDELRAASGQPRVVILAHSMGGLVARAWLARDGETARSSLARLITLGTPHHGTAMANFGGGASARQMARRKRSPSAWLGELDRAETPAVRARITSIYSLHDNIVAPHDAARLDGARNIVFSGIGHVALGSDAAVQRCVIDEILAASPLRPVPGNR